MDNSTLHINHIKSDGTAGSEEPELNLQPGQIMALEGSMGSGRTTLVKAILGLGDPGNRRIHVGGFDPRTDELEARRLIAYVSEDLIFPTTLMPSGVGRGVWVGIQCGRPAKSGLPGGGVSSW